MEVHDWLLFSSIALVATITPGPAILLVTSQSAAYGWRYAILTILGNITGLFIMSALSILGLSAVILSSALIFEGVKLIGAAYLVYLGFRLWRNGLVAWESGSEVRPASMRHRWGYFRGLAIALSNPKAIAFTTALFPQFIDFDGILPLQFTVLISTFMLLSFSCLLGYALAVEHARSRFLQSGSRIFGRLFGSAFILAGIGLAGATREQV